MAGSGDRKTTDDMRQDYSDVVVLIPSYKPGPRLLKLISDLSKAGLDAVIVNDGSGPEYDEIFKNCAEAGAVVIGYSNNCGKGHALKHGFEYVATKNYTYVVTADCDGQHKPEDICRVADKLKAGNNIVLTVRGIKKDAPFRSRFGNTMSRFFFAIANARYLPDNQSGLRGFATSNINWMLKVRGEKYDYELNVVLMAEKQGLEISTIPIEAIYIDNNADSHFRPLRDTILIYVRYIQTVACAAIALLINILSVLFLSDILKVGFFYLIIVLNWLIYLLLCFVIERYIVFRDFFYTPGVRRLALSIAKYTSYYLICMLFVHLIPIAIPMTVYYVLSVIMIEIAEYLLLKATYDH